jgi:hypothetical protein
MGGVLDSVVAALTSHPARPSLCPGPMPQGVSYVQISVVYIRNIIPTRIRLPRRRSWAVWGGAMPNFALKLSKKSGQPQNERVEAYESEQRGLISLRYDGDFCA